MPQFLQFLAIMWGTAIVSVWTVDHYGGWVCLIVLGTALAWFTWGITIGASRKQEHTERWILIHAEQELTEVLDNINIEDEDSAKAFHNTVATAVQVLRWVLNKPPTGSFDEFLREVENTNRAIRENKRS